MKLTLREKIDVAEGTKAFLFEPEGPVRFTAGQFGDFSLTDPPYTDEKGNTRTFSIASAPENDNLMIATRMRDSAFKRSLAEAPAGTSVRLMGPMGSFTLHEDPARPAVFLTGGIGITPVRSIVEHAVIQRLRHRIWVLYSNTTRARTAFLDDFEGWSEGSANIAFIPTLTDETPPDWKYETGLLNRDMLSRQIPDLQEPIYYVVGPPGMVTAIREMLEEIELDDTQIRIEDFAGY